MTNKKGGKLYPFKLYSLAIFLVRIYKTGTTVNK